MLYAGIEHDVIREAMWTAVVISSPILGIALLVGFIIGLLQALTSIQEMTLTFVPKLLAIVVTFAVSMGFMTDHLVDFFQTRIIPLMLVL